jgi:glucose-1-phosphate thymidylyltransferase
LEFDYQDNAISIEEKLENSKSNYAILGIYFYDNEVIEIAKAIKPSQRGELELTDINIAYINQGKLKVSILDRATAWLDTSTYSSIMQAIQFVEVIEERQGSKICAIEEVAYKMGYISKGSLQELAMPLLKSGYGEYLSLLK